MDLVDEARNRRRGRKRERDTKGEIGERVWTGELSGGGSHRYGKY